MKMRATRTPTISPRLSRRTCTQTETRHAAHRDPAWRARALEDLETKTMIRPNWAALEVAESSKHPEMVDRRVVELAAEREQTPFDFMLDLSMEEDLETRFRSVLANNDPDAIA